MDVYGVGDHGGGATHPVLDQGVRWMQPDKVAPENLSNGPSLHQNSANDGM
jgi:hypothetical protein